MDKQLIRALRFANGTPCCSILTEIRGKAKYEDLIDGVTMEEKLEELTGLTRRVVDGSKDKDTRPRLVIVEMMVSVEDSWYQQ